MVSVMIIQTLLHEQSEMRAQYTCFMPGFFRFVVSYRRILAKGDTY